MHGRSLGLWLSDTFIEIKKKRLHVDVCVRTHTPPSVVVSVSEAC